MYTRVGNMVKRRGENLISVDSIIMAGLYLKADTIVGAQTNTLSKNRIDSKTMRFSVGSGSGTLSIAEYGEKPLGVSGVHGNMHYNHVSICVSLSIAMSRGSEPIAHITDKASLKNLMSTWS